MGAGVLTKGRSAKLRFSWAEAPIARARMQASNTRAFFIVFSSLSNLNFGVPKCRYERPAPDYRPRARTRRVCVKCVARTMHWRSFASHLRVIRAKRLKTKDSITARSRAEALRESEFRSEND